MTKDTIPQNFTMGLVLFDAVPVILFGMASWILWILTGSPLVLLGGAVCFVSGMLKVLWKGIVVVRQKNVWPLFIQMRIGMPVGFIMLIAGFVIACVTKDMAMFLRGLARPLPVIFIIIFILGMAAMIVCGAKLNSEDLRANRIEQSCNCIAQGAFFLAMLFVYLQ